jgi:hypothetical protein
MSIGLVKIIKRLTIISITTCQDIIPFHTTQISHVSTVSASEADASGYHAAGIAASSYTILSPAGVMTLENERTAIYVPVAPSELADVTARAANFVDDPTSTTLQMRTVANWTLGVYVASFFCLLAVLYLSFFCGFILRDIFHFHRLRRA